MQVDIDALDERADYYVQQGVDEHEAVKRAVQDGLRVAES